MDADKSNSTGQQPWEDLEFGTSVLNSGGAGALSAPSKHSGSNHVENAAKDQGGESFWDALKAENGDTATSSADSNNKVLMKMTTDDRRWSVSGLGLPRINSQALAAAQSEHRMTLREGLRNYPRAIFWSAALSLAIVGEGFDTSLINSFYAYSTFQRSYGVPVGDGNYQITAKWQNALNNGSVAGAIVGLLLNGVLSERLGYRKSLLLALGALCCFIFLSFFAFNIETLLAGQILCGMPWGICSTLTISYAAEVMPLALRGHLIANVNLCWIIGQIIALGTLRGFLRDKSEWSYRIPFSIQWVWIAIVGTATWFAPESPWWLCRKKRYDEARQVLLRLANNSPGFNADNVIAMMRHTDEVEKQLNNGKAERNDLSFFECFRGTNLRRTEIACMTFMTQNMCGLPLIGFAAYFYSEIGFSSLLSFNLTLGMHGLAFMACLLALVLMKRFGRRTIYLGGLSGCATILLVASILGTVPQSQAVLWGQAAMVICFIFVFDLTLGPVTYSLVAEIPSTRLRVNTVSIARIAYNVNALITNIIAAHALSPLSWNLQGKSNWIWTGTCLLCLVYCYFRLPEPKGLTYHELDILFEKKASARKFATIQKRLEETGYFGFYEEQSDGDPAWR